MSFIYKITDTDGNYYIGSTTDFKQRKKSHINNAKFGKAPFQQHFNDIGWNNVEFSIVEMSTIIDKVEYRKLENQYINLDDGKCLNTRNAYLDRDKWREENKDKIQRYNKNYYANNKEEKALANKKYHDEHKEELYEKQKIYRENNLEKARKWARDHHHRHKDEKNAYSKEWYEKNKDTERQKQKEYKDKNKEQIYKDNKERYEKNKERYRKAALESGKVSVECPNCHSMLRKDNLSKHKKSK